MEALENMNLLNPNSKFLIYKDNLRVLNFSFKNKELSLQEVYSHNHMNYYDEPLFEHDLPKIELYPSYEEYIEAAAYEIFDLYYHYIDDYDKELEEELSKKIDPSTNPDQFRLAYHNTIRPFVNTHPEKLEVLNKSYIRDNVIELVENEE